MMQKQEGRQRWQGGKTIWQLQKQEGRQQRQGGEMIWRLQQQGGVAAVARMNNDSVATAVAAVGKE